MKHLKRFNESFDNEYKEIEIDDAKMDLFKTNATLRDLISNRDVILLKNNLQYKNEVEEILKNLNIL